MKTLISLLIVSLLVAGCASMQETYFLDREFGQASQASFDKMITYPDYRYATQIPEGLEGIHAEGIMKVYDETFHVKAKTVDIIKIGLETGGQ